MPKSLTNKKAQEAANKLRSAIQEMRAHRKTLVELGYEVVIDGGTVTVSKQERVEI